MLELEEKFSPATVRVLLIAIIGASIVFLCGISTDIFRGDETVHYRIAQQIYDTKACPLYDPVLHTNVYAKKVYNIEMLWHAGLAGFWYIIRGQSASIAQLYQAFWYFSLIIGVYMLATHFYDKTVGLCSALITATIPSTLAYTIMLYIDVSASALSVFCVLCLAKKRYALSGILLGLMILTKRNTLLFIPALIFWLLYNQREMAPENVSGRYAFLRSLFNKRSLIKLLIFIAPAILIKAPDFLFHQENLSTLASSTNSSLGIPMHRFMEVTFVHPSSIISHPEAVVKEMGLILILTTFLYFVKNFSKGDVFIMSFGLSYIILFPTILVLSVFYKYKGLDLYVLCTTLPKVLYSSIAVRYFLPAFPFFAILGAKAAVDMGNIRGKKILYAIILLCFVQGVATTTYVHKFRKMPEGLKETYHFINNNLPRGSTILCTESSLTLYTSCMAMWNSENTMPELYFLFWKAGAQEALEILQRYNIKYILVEKENIADDTFFYNVSGYPKSFVRKLPSFNFLELIYTNKDVNLWEVCHIEYLADK